MPRDINELPNNQEAECGLIGVTLLKGYIPTVARSLATTDFYDRQNRETWSAFLELTEENRTIDALTAIEIVKRNSGREIKPSELMAMVSGIPTTHETTLAEQVRSAAVRRRMISKLNDGIQSLVRGDKGVIGTLRRELDDLEYAEESRGSFVSMAEVVERDVKPALYDLEKGITNRISTGWPEIDRHIGGGLSLSDILLVVGLPGGGKSAFVLQLASQLAMQGYPVAFLSGEMHNRENGLRLLSQLSDSYNLNSATHISASERDELLLPWADKMAALPIEWDCRTYDLQTLSIGLRSLVAEKGIKALVIDYIQLLKLHRFDKNGRTERITEASQEVKRIAMEFGIAVIEVAQFNREGALSEKPKMQHLEGSSQLEKDTSLIFIIDREEGTQNVTIRIVKGRNTGTAEIPGVFAGWKLKFNF